MRKSKEIVELLKSINWKLDKILKLNEPESNESELLRKYELIMSYDPYGTEEPKC